MKTSALSTCSFIISSNCIVPFYLKKMTSIDLFKNKYALLMMFFQNTSFHICGYKHSIFNQQYQESINVFTYNVHFNDIISMQNILWEEVDESPIVNQTLNLLVSIIRYNLSLLKHILIFFQDASR